MKPYKPISCDYYDVLINYALFKTEVEIIGLDDEVMAQGIIKDVYTKEKEEFCIVGETHIRLDLIKHVLELGTNKNGVNNSHSFTTSTL